MSDTTTSPTDSDHRVSLFGMKIDPLRLDEAARRVLEWALEDSPNGCRYVVTPNVDHAVKFQEHEGLRRAYDRAAMVVADGAPLILASRLLGRGLPERVAGSDLAPKLFDLAEQSSSPLRVFLLGAGPGVAERAAENMHKKWPSVRVVGVHCPPLGFEKDEAENAKIHDAIRVARPDVVVVGLGAPKQELWVSEHRDRIEAKVALCVGATIDFLAGEKQRSPEWMQRAGLEWLHRLLTEPKRLARRYAYGAWVFPRLVWSEYRGTPARRGD